MQQDIAALPVGAIIRERYTVEKLLAQHDVDLTYLVEDCQTKQGPFMLKERRDSQIVDRRRFIFTYIVLKQLSHPALPAIYRVFEDKHEDRAYALMQYIVGQDLESLRLEQSDGTFPVPTTLSLFSPIVHALTYLHHHDPPILHRDITPANIIVPESHNTVLSNFGIARTDLTRHSEHTTPPCSPGYAAPEQYQGETTPYSDIYGLAATLYTVLTGLIPPDANDRLTQLATIGFDPLVPANHHIQSIPTTIADALSRAMALESAERFPSIEEFWLALNIYPTKQPIFAETSTEPFLRITTSAFSIPIAHIRTHILPSLSSSITRIPTQILPSLSSPSRPYMRISRLKPYVRILAPALLALVLLSGTGLWAMLLPHSGNTLAHHPAPHTRSMNSPILYPHIANAYDGSIHLGDAHDGTFHAMVQNSTTKLFLTAIQQHQGNIRGYVTIGGDVQGNGSFTGIVSPPNTIHFTVTSDTGHTLRAFEGTIQTGGFLAGSYCGLDQSAHCTGNNGNGLWSVEPV